MPTTKAIPEATAKVIPEDTTRAISEADETNSEDTAEANSEANSEVNSEATIENATSGCSTPNSHGVLDMELDGNLYHFMTSPPPKSYVEQYEDMPDELIDTIAE